MADKYVNLSRNGSGYAGTDADPYSWADVVAAMPSTDTFYMRGIASLTANFSDSSAFEFRAWDTEAYGPWRLYGGNSYNFSATGASLYNGILHANTITLKSLDGMYVREYAQLNLGSSGTVTRSTLIYTNTIYITNAEESTIQYSNVLSIDSTSYITVGAGATLNISNCCTDAFENNFIDEIGTLNMSDIQYSFMPISNPEWADSDLAVFNHIPGCGVGSSGYWAETLAALWTATPRYGRAPITIQFTDESTGDPVAWEWDFGDGSTSTDQNPTHEYAENGEYTVTLTVYNDATKTEPSWVTSGNYYTEEEISGGSLDTDWWNNAWQDDVTIQSYGGEYCAVMGTVASYIRVTPADVSLTGDFDLISKINFGPGGGANKSMHFRVIDSDTDTALCQIKWTDSGAPGDVNWQHLDDCGFGTGSQDLDSIAGLPSVNGSIWFRLVREDSLITAYYSEDGTTWSPANGMTNPFDLSFNSYTDVYIEIDGATVYGWELFRFQSVDAGNEKLLKSSSSSKSGFIRLFEAVAFPISALGYRSGRVAYHYGTPDNKEQGIGWSEIQDADWVWPDSPASLINMNDSDGYRLALGCCSRDGMFYILNTRDGSASSFYSRRYLDKYDPNDSSSGTEIPATIKLPERYGSKQHFTMQHVETHAHFRPQEAENRGATGYTSTGQRTNQAFYMNMYKDGENTVSAREKILPEDRELMFVRHIRANTMQLEFVTITSEFELGRVESYYTVYDRARHPSANSNDNNLQSTNHDINLTYNIFWLSRGDNMGMERVTQGMAGIIDSKVTGPDGKTESGAIFQA